MSHHEMLIWGMKSRVEGRRSLPAPPSCLFVSSVSVMDHLCDGY